MGEQQFLFLDFEFTMPQNRKKPKGFFPEIIEVGLVSVVDCIVENTYSSYVRPEAFPSLTDRCKKFLGINQEAVDRGISFLELVEKLVQYEKRCQTTIVTWGNMDMKVLKHNCEAVGVEFPFSGQCRDLSLEYKRFFGERNQTGLWKAIEAYGKVGTGKHHCALDDAMTTYNIFKLVEKDKEYLVKPSPPTLGELIDFSKVLKKVSTQ
ncbi:or 3'-5' exonuclease KapD [Bacillus cereus]|uniref:3'-5' exonuclease KapD n=1 Tax=Bacillus arachidis TaxID=2819290 RepID=A0ABS3NSC1_9BACI|nr:MULTISPECIES: 3'-5' exonuclease KapD [Bacillus]MBO1623658.1 3'-5' exonuclease KapD [Bacillus arachidis]PGX95968.1 or 3'-5' exonuclease KapD [Bacillus cereus]WIY60853.1 3'-5' exonuclease KapD [Bacillus arachidis]SDZ30443.1 sporulation inhibitor KapD [Bacillus sp. 166amftsu]